MIKIKEVFNNNKIEYNAILDVIEALNSEVEGVAHKFSTYICSETANSFEKQYIRELQKNINELAKTVLKDYFGGMNREELIKFSIDSLMDGPYSFESHYDNCEVGEFFEFYSNRNYKTVIISYMKTTLNNLYTKLERDAMEEKAQKEKNRIKSLIDDKASLERRLIQINSELEKYSTTLN